MPAEARSLTTSRRHLRLVHDANRSILIAGGDAARREALVRELAARMPGTSFEQAVATWEVLERAPSSRLVMLAGALADGSSEAAMHLLGSRHPRLPVVALGDDAGRTT